jgi:hypothetical protein
MVSVDFFLWAMDSSRVDISPFIIIILSVKIQSTMVIAISLSHVFLIEINLIIVDTLDS